MIKRACGVAYSLLSVLLLLLVGGCGRVSQIEWESPVERALPLVGRIWDVKAGTVIREETLLSRLGWSRFVIRGERHDNPDHHALQAKLVRALIGAGRRPAVGFEMLSTDDAPALARYLARSPKDAAGLGDAVNWTRSGWPEWRFYQPIAQAALDGNLLIVATNLSRPATEAVRRNGLTGLGPALATRSEEHTSELQSRSDLVCRLLLEKKKKNNAIITAQHKRCVLISH